MAYKETFISPFPLPSKESAERVLDDIRKTHVGWKEISAKVEQREDGQWYVIRVHEKP